VGRRRLSSWLWSAAALAALGASFVFFGRGERPSIVLISIDTLRADHLGCYGYARTTSPYVDSLAQGGTVLDNAMVPLPATDPSHASLLTALHPLRHGVLSNSMRLGPEAETIAEVLARHGYHTMGVTAVRHLGGEYGFDQGFVEFSDERTRHSRPASEVNRSAVEMLERYAARERRPPFFLFVHYFDAHSPYEVRSRYLPSEALVERPHGLSAKDRERIQGYDSEIRLVDAHIERLLERMSELDPGRDVLVCVLSDHGEQFGEHGYSGGHADFYRETVRIPVIFNGPGVPRRRLDRMASSLDVAPTLLHEAGARFSGPVDGIDILHPDGSAESSAPRSLLVLGYPSHTRSLQVLEDPWAYIRNLDHVYGAMRAERLTTADAEALVETGFAAPPRRDQGDTAVYQVSETRLDPGLVTAVVFARDGCEATLDLGLEPRMSYLAKPMRLSEGALRLDYPVSRRDTTTLAVAPRGCARGVFVRRTTSGDGVAAPTAVPQLFANLETARKTSVADELYDFRQDAPMRRNLLDSSSQRPRAAQLQRRLASLFARHSEGALPGDTRRDYTPQELETLRSLGYVR
jgi:hypothetical protein